MFTGERFTLAIIPQRCKLCISRNTVDQSTTCSAGSHWSSVIVFYQLAQAARFALRSAVVTCNSHSPPLSLRCGGNEELPHVSYTIALKPLVHSGGLFVFTAERKRKVERSLANDSHLQSFHSAVISAQHIHLTFNAAATNPSPS